MNYKYVGIMGAAGVGKDTAADALLAADPSWSKLSFAKPLKDVTAKVFGIPIESLNDLDEKEKIREPIIIDSYLLNLEWEINQLIMPTACSSNYQSLRLLPRGLIAKSYRQLLQYVGTDYVRFVCDTFWVDYVVKYQIPLHQNVVIADARFENEIKAVHDLHGLVLAIEREDVTCANNHSSARDLKHLADHVLLFPLGGFTHIKRWAQLFAHDIPEWKMYESTKLRAFLNAYGNGLPLDDCAAILGISNKTTLHTLAQDYAAGLTRANTYY
jgi:hypothetical protein